MENPTVCRACHDGAPAFDISMAFQPIVDLATRTVYAQEALVRGLKGEGASEVIGRIPSEDIYHFDQACRVTAIREAVAYGLDTRLHVNFLPGAVYEPENCIRVTLAAAEKYDLPLSCLTFEVVESEKIRDLDHLASIIACYRELGFLTALDDFGQGASSLNLLAAVRPDIVKLDLQLIRGLDQDPVRRAIVRSVVTLGNDIGFTLIAEGIETANESTCLLDIGIPLQQGYLFARPQFQGFGRPTFSSV